ncbi:MAG: sulfur oxidation c-type cytochrome SoxX [Xanthobacteraceae bacterium]
MRRALAALVLVTFGLSAFPPAVSLGQSALPAPARADTAINRAFPTAPPEWRPRLTADETMRQCSAHRNAPPKAVAEAIQQRERASIRYPAGEKLMGEWEKGEAVAQSGYGLRFTDYPPRAANGGNCYACHQITRDEVSYGTLGPSLLHYGKQRNFGAAETKAVYDKIYNSQASFPCSSMPRFGANQILTMEQIKDLVALLMSPDSRANK